VDAKSAQRARFVRGGTAALAATLAGSVFVGEVRQEMRDEGSSFAHVSVVQAVVPQPWVEKELHIHSEGYRVEMVSIAEYAVTGAASAHPLAWIHR
jgi:hypothetical protein